MTFDRHGSMYQRSEKSRRNRQAKGAIRRWRWDGLLPVIAMWSVFGFLIPDTAIGGDRIDAQLLSGEQISSMYDTAPIYMDMRDLAFHWIDDEVLPDKPMAFILETGFPEGAVTVLVTNGKGASIYYSSGGGVIGGGDWPGPALATKKFMALADEFANKLPVVHEAPLPQIGETRMYLTFGTEMRGIAADEEEFGDGRSPFSPLFYAANEVIHAILEIDEKLRAGPPANSAPNE